MINDIYRIKFTQTYGVGGQECINVFYYKQITEGGVSEGADALLPAFQSEVYPAIENIQCSIMFTVEILVENVVPSADNASVGFGPSAEPSERVGQALPPYATWAFRLNRSTNASRHGQKRFAGVAEEDQNAGLAVGPIVALLDTCAAKLDDVIGGPPPDTATFQPVIYRVGRPGKTIPTKIIPALIPASFTISTAQYVGISTQNSRKFNVGS